VVRHSAVVAAEAIATGAVFVALYRWQAYLEVSQRANANTRRQYRRLMLAFFADVLGDPAWPGPRDPLMLTEDDLVTYLNAYTTAQGQQRGMMLRALRSFYAFLAYRDEIPKDPAVRLKPPRPKVRSAPALDVGVIEQVIEAAPEVDPRAPHAITLQYVTLCRVSSLIAVTERDVRRGANGWSVMFSEAKGDKPYEVPLEGRGRRVVQSLLALADYRPRRGRRRPTLVRVGYERYRQWIKVAGAEVGVDISTHLVRHPAITRLAERPDVDVRSIQELAKLEDPRPLPRYAKASDPRLRNAVGVFG
jgi:integrase/recombinase XerD